MVKSANQLRKLTDSMLIYCRAYDISCLNDYGSYDRLDLEDYNYERGFQNLHLVGSFFYDEANGEIVHYSCETEYVNTTLAEAITSFIAKVSEERETLLLAVSNDIDNIHKG